jgi:hypothetical protein
MKTLDVRHDLAIDAVTRDELARLTADLERRFPELPPPIVLPWSDQQAVALDRGRPWMYGPATTDPLMGERGPAVLPRPQRRQLARIAATGARFDAIGVAHELDPEGPATSLLSLLDDGPRTCSEAVARELVGPVPAHPGVTRAVGALAALVRRDLPSQAVRALDRLLDPVIFGVVAPSPLTHGAPSVWQPLVAWRW